MTLPKAALSLPPRPRCYPGREECAAEFNISPETWDQWVKQGVAPPAMPGSPKGTPRWRWVDVDEWMSNPAARPRIVARYKGETDDVADVPGPATVDPFVVAAGNLRHAPSKGRRRGR